MWMQTDSWKTKPHGPTEEEQEREGSDLMESQVLGAGLTQLAVEWRAKVTRHRYHMYVSMFSLEGLQMVHSCF